MEILGTWENRIQAAVDEYINVKLRGDEQKLYDMLGVFTGMLSWIYRTVFKPEKCKVTERRTLVDLEDNAVMSEMVDCFMDLCQIYNHPTCINDLTFGTFIGIDGPDVIEFDRGNGPAAACNAFKRIQIEAAARLSNNVSERNSVGSMFVLKARHEWRDSAPVQQIEIHTAAPQLTRADLGLLETED